MTSSTHGDPEGGWIEAAKAAKAEGRLKRWTAMAGLISSIIQTVGIVIGGAWVATKFGLFEWPSINSRLQVRSDELDWFDTPDPEVCMGKLGITVKNVSKQTVRIEEIEVGVWIAAVPPGDFAYIGPAKIAKDH